MLARDVRVDALAGWCTSASERAVPSMRPNLSRRGCRPNKWQPCSRHARLRWVNAAAWGLARTGIGQGSEAAMACCLVREYACSQPGDLLLLAAGPASLVNKAMDRVRNFLGESLGGVREGEHKLLWIVDFPMFELNEEVRELRGCGALPWPSRVGTADCNLVTLRAIGRIPRRTVSKRSITPSPPPTRTTWVTSRGHGRWRTTSSTTAWRLAVAPSASTRRRCRRRRDGCADGTRVGHGAPHCGHTDHWPWGAAVSA